MDRSHLFYKIFIDKPVDMWYNDYSKGKEVSSMTKAFENITLNGRDLSDRTVLHEEALRLFNQADLYGDCESAIALCNLLDWIEWDNWVDS